MKRLKYAQVLRLRNSDEVTIVVPEADRRHSILARKFWKLFLSDVRKSILDGLSHLTPDKREDIYVDHLARRSFQREGKTHVEFHVRIVSYPERDVLSKKDLPQTLLNHYLGEGGNGFYEMFW